MIRPIVETEGTCRLCLWQNPSKRGGSFSFPMLGETCRRGPVSVTSSGGCDARRIRLGWAGCRRQRLLPFPGLLQLPVPWAFVCPRDRRPQEGSPPGGRLSIPHPAKSFDPAAAPFARAPACASASDKSPGGRLNLSSVFLSYSGRKRYEDLAKEGEQ